MTDKLPTGPRAPGNGSEHATWIAGRVQTLLSHYFQTNAPAELIDAAIDDWVDVLVRFSQPAIEHACATHLRNQPRRRPTPGDIAAICEAWTRDRQREALGSDLTPEQARAVEWAVMTGRMGREGAVRAVRRQVSVPEWCNTEAQVAVYKIRTDENCMTPDGAGVTQYKRMVRA